MCAKHVVVWSAGPGEHIVRLCRLLVCSTRAVVAVGVCVCAVLLAAGVAQYSSRMSEVVYVCMLPCVRLSSCILCDVCVWVLTREWAWFCVPVFLVGVWGAYGGLGMVFQCGWVWEWGTAGLCVGDGQHMFESWQLCVKVGAGGSEVEDRLEFTAQYEAPAAKEGECTGVIPCVDV